MPDIVVHHLENSRSIRALWILEEIGVDYAIREYKRDPKTLRAGADLREVHPLGKSPVVEVDGVVLAESGAILEELVERFGEGLRPADDANRRRYRHLMHYAEGSLMPPLLVQLVLSQIRKAKVPFFIKPVTKRIAGQVNKAYAKPEVARHLDYLEGLIGGADWFAGDFSAADVQLFYPVDAIGMTGGLEGHPRLKAWVARCRGREAYVRAAKKGGENAGFDR